ncbi:unnamed protein product [Leptidea sinapis]|uniref:RING-type E3 ubiquitin transferase BRCA1 n=1 Tax=Leptidea sinapis TaxID=189913 RepID=A0A5E4QIE1_9NEOP|nr:unnamed protein product [Leptidea sinapis]
MLFSVPTHTCCKYYKVPTISKCGHNLCQSCWRKNPVCPICKLKLDRKGLTLNLPKQKVTEDILRLVDEFEKYFRKNLDDFIFSKCDNIQQSVQNKNVDEWLSSSQNKFSAPTVDSQDSTQEVNAFVNVIVEDIQIHAESNKIKNNSVKSCKMQQQQDDWNKIEVLESEDFVTKDKENIVGPMDIEQCDYLADEVEYTVENPRRSSRKNIEFKEMELNKIHNEKTISKPLNIVKAQNKKKINSSVETFTNMRNALLVGNNLDKNCDTQNKKIHTSMIKDKMRINENMQDSLIKDNIDSEKVIYSNEIKNHTNKNNIASNMFSRNKITTETNTLNTDPNRKNVLFHMQSSLYSRVKYNSVLTDAVNDGSEIETEPFHNDDIELTIKIGNTVTNIMIKKNKNIQVNVNADKEVQTTLRESNLDKATVATSPIKEFLEDKGDIDRIVYSQPSKNTLNGRKVVEGVSHSLKSVSDKKNTASAITTSVQTIATESIEKVLSTMMESRHVPTNQNLQQSETNNDINNTKSYIVKECATQSLQSAKSTPSAIILPSYKHRTKSQLCTEKRGRELLNSELEPDSKKLRANNIEVLPMESKKIEQDSDSYGVIMSQVFTHDDVDMKANSKRKIINKNTQILSDCKSLKAELALSQRTKQNTVELYSQNLFTISEKDIDIEAKKTHTQKSIASHKEHKTDANNMSDCVMEPHELCTPQDNDCDSDESVVEETPQKSTSFSKKKVASNKAIDEITANDDIISQNTVKQLHQFQQPYQIRNTSTSQNVTLITNVKDSLETPPSISNFSDQIQHKSTPNARKSLNFKDSVERINDSIEKTLCPSLVEIVSTTQEKEFMSKAFEQNHMIQSKGNDKGLNYFVAGSFLSSAELANTRMLCARRNWTYLDKYSNELTHLVVGSNGDKKGQRTLKFMCAVAASKWVVSYEWEPYEMLDAMGEPGPKRSRLSKVKLFSSITFFCMPPFSVLDSDTLQEMLEAAGGKVVKDFKQIQNPRVPSLVLAEPEDTQDQRFIDLAEKAKIVPVNFEWVLNCIGKYTLDSIRDLLLCPESSLPQAAATWLESFM